MFWKRKTAANDQNVPANNEEAGPSDRNENVPNITTEVTTEAAQQDEGYDPYKHRKKRASASSNFEVFINLIKGSMGVGILSMPFAFKSAGLVMGVISTLALGSLSLYGLHVLLNCQYYLCKQNQVPYFNYSETMREAIRIGPQILRKFANSAKLLVDVTLIMVQLGICTTYYLFVFRTMHMTIKHYDKNRKTPKPLLILMLLIPFILICFVRNMRILTPLSIQGIFFSFIAFSIIMFQIAEDIKHPKGTEYFERIWEFPIFFGMCLFAIESTGIVLSVDRDMEKPESLRKPFGLLTLSVAVSVFLNASIGFIGYWCYGKNVAILININVRHDTSEYVLCQILLGLAMYISFPLQLIGVMDILWVCYIKPKLKRNKYILGWELLVRSLIVTATALFAMAIPSVQICLTGVGAILFAIVSQVYPFFIQICCNWEKGPQNIKFLLIKNGIIITFSIIGAMTGLAATIIQSYYFAHGYYT